MSISLIRPLRRFLTKKCGGYKRFLLVLSSLILVAYSLRALFIDNGRQIWNVRRMLGNLTNPCEVTCSPNQLSFYIRTGEKTQVAGYAPLICFQGTMYMSAELGNVGRGLNVLLIDSKSLLAKDTRVFDTYIDESPLLRFLKKEAKDEDILLLATYDDASYGLKESGRQWLKLFGSSLIDQLGFRENFIMIGHRGLVKGNAIEYHVAKKDKSDSFAPQIEKAGCFSFPLGDRVSMENTMPDVLQGNEIKVGKRSLNCGLPKPCPIGSVSVSVDTGQGNTRQPSICVDNFIRLDESINDAGRGFNLVVLSPETLQTTKISHMDTYTYDSTDLELFLESLHHGDILIAVIADDASKKLGQNARDQLNKMGSGHIQNLRFRDVWYFVGQKGIDGFTQLEQLSFAAFDGSWPKPLMASFCVPKTVPSSQIMIEPEGRRNDQRRQFCLKYEGYMDFCNPANVDDELKAIPVADKDLRNHKIFDVPIIIVPGLNHNAFVYTLQTALMQPGIRVENVGVFWDEKLPEYGELAVMFGFGNYSLASSLSYTEQLIKAMIVSMRTFPDSDFKIIIEEDLLLAPDFMSFMAQCLDLILKDSTIAGASAWNINGFEHVSGSYSQVYRVQDFPGLGFIARSEIIQRIIDYGVSCCKDRAWFGWSPLSIDLEMLTPDVSRVYRTPFYGAEAATDLARSLFLKPRITYLNVEPAKLDLQTLTAEMYENFLHNVISTSQVVPASHLLECVTGSNIAPDLSFLMRGPLTVCYYQENKSDMNLLIKLCHCFGLVVMNNEKPKNLHNGLLRFYYQTHDIFLIGTSTVYYNSLSNKTDVLTLPQIET